MLLFASVIWGRRTFDRDGQTDRHHLLYTYMTSLSGCAAQVAGQTDTLLLRCFFVAERERGSGSMDPSQAVSLVVCFFLGSGGRKKYFVAGAHFLLLFASVMRRRGTFDRDGQTDRQTIVIFIPI